jgi:hypothetical protein
MAGNRKASNEAAPAPAMLRQHCTRSVLCSQYVLFGGVGVVLAYFDPYWPVLKPTVAGIEKGIYEELEIFPLSLDQRNRETGPLSLNPGAEGQVDDVAPLIGVYPNNLRELISSSRVQFDRHDSFSSAALVAGLFHSFTPARRLVLAGFRA